MVEIAKAEQGELRKTSAVNVPMIGREVLDGDILILNLQADKFFSSALTRKADPNEGWKLEEGILEEERAESLRGVCPKSVEVIQSHDSGLEPLVRIEISEIDTDNPQNHQEIGELIGPLAALRYVQLETETV